MTSKNPKHILQLSSEEKRNFLNSFDTIISDIDGVVWNLRSKIGGAPEGFKALQNAGKNLIFITNNSVRSIEECDRKFKNANLNVDVENIWHPAKTVVKYLKNIHFDGLIYLIAGENFKKLLQDNGFHIIDGPNEILAESIGTIAGYAFDRQPVRAVVIDFDVNLSAIKLIRAEQYLMSPECLFIAGATDMRLPMGADASILGPGPFLKILKESTNKEIITLGKPGTALAEVLKKEICIKDSSRVLMIGDMLEQDIGFGSEVSFQTLAVLSGGTNLNELRSQTNSKLIPDYYADSMKDFVEFMKNSIKL